MYIVSDIAVFVLKRDVKLQLTNSEVHESILIIFGENVTDKVGNQKRFIFPPHLTNDSALPAMGVKFGVSEQTKGVHLHAKVHLNVFVVSFSGTETVQVTQLRRTLASSS